MFHKKKSLPEICAIRTPPPLPEHTPNYSVGNLKISFLKFRKQLNLKEERPKIKL